MNQRLSTLLILLNLIFLAGCGDIEPEDQSPTDSPTSVRIFTEDKDKKQTPLKCVNYRYQCKEGDKVIIEVQHRGIYHKLLSAEPIKCGDTKIVIDRDTSSKKHIERFIISNLTEGVHGIKIDTRVLTDRLTSPIRESQKAELENEIKLVIEVKKQ